MSSVVLAIYRFSLFLYEMKIPFLPTLITKVFIRMLFGCHIGLGARIGRGVCLAYGGLGTTIHNGAVIGDNVYIGPNVTIGGTNKNVVVPVVGDNCLISTGVRIIGPVSVGKNCVIGANAVVVTDIPDNSCAVGVPARVIKTGIDVSQYR